MGGAPRDAYVRGSLLAPDAFVLEGYTPDMPSSATLGISPQDVEDLVAYVMSLT